jgi:small subunit ribosomal protein S1
MSMSSPRPDQDQIWETIEKIKQDDGLVRGRVVEVVKGGLILDVGVRGFLPASLIEWRRVRDLEPYVGRDLEVKIVELDRDRGNLVVSRRAAIERAKLENSGEMLRTLHKGQICRGHVSSVVSFGAFIDLGGVDGLVHVSELSWRHIDHPSDVVEPGQEVEVEVIAVDLERKRVSLSLKATQEDPWRQFARTHPSGQILPGTVTKLVPFGAFVRIGDGVEGLVHLSELAERHVELPEQVTRPGAEAIVKILGIDLDRRRISLSIKQANAAWAEGEEHFDPSLYGMSMSYDDAGNYVYPDGFDPATGEWLPGFEEQRAAWERQYAEARDRWAALGRQVLRSREG